MILERVRPVKDHARLVPGQDIDRDTPRLVLAIDESNLKMRRAEVVFALEDIDATSQDSILQRHVYPPRPI
jgi:hypothetical protein